MKSKQKKPRKARSYEALTAILHCKASIFHDKREPRKGSKNYQDDIKEEYDMTKLNVIYTDEENVKWTNQKICAHCSYFAHDSIANTSECYDPANEYISLTAATACCDSWRIRKDAQHIKNCTDLRSMPEIIPAKFSFEDEADDE